MTMWRGEVAARSFCAAMVNTMNSPSNRTKPPMWSEPFSTRFAGLMSEFCEVCAELEKVRKGEGDMGKLMDELVDLAIEAMGTHEWAVNQEIQRLREANHG